MFLLVFWSPKQVKTEESYEESWAKLRIHLPRVNSDCKEKKQRESAIKPILDDSRSSHFWSTFWSPIDACYIPFQISGSQQSNASNDAQFGVETRKLQPLQVNHSKLKEAFWKVLRNHPFVAFVQCWGFPPEVARYMRQVGSWEPQTESQLRSAARLAFCCKVILQPFLSVCEISQTPFFSCEMVPKASRYLLPTLGDIFHQIFVV